MSLKNSLLTAACLVCMMPVTVFAHATPLEYQPAASSIVATAPQTVEIRFSERIEPAASSITVLGPDGSSIDTGTSVVDSIDAHLLRIGMRSAGSGTYTVSWQVISADDGHFTKGGFIFSVGRESAGGAADQGSFQIQHRSDWPEAITLFLELLGGAILLAVLALTATLRPVIRSLSEASRERLRRRLMMLLWSAGALILIGTLTYLWIEGGNLAYDQSVSFSSALRSFLATLAGRFTVYRLILGLAMTVFFTLSLRRMLSASRVTVCEWILAAMIVAIDVLRARVSHAAASSFLPDFSIAVNAIHLLFKDLWIGGLVVLLLAILPALDREKNLRLTIRTLLTFSNILMLALAVGGVSGVYIVWLHLKSATNLFSTHWGGYFIALAAYALVLFVLRLHQQRSILPALVRVERGTANANDDENARSLGIALLAETFVGVAVLLFSSILIITTPPLSPQVYFQQTQTTAQGTLVFGEHRFENDQMLVTALRPASSQSGSGETMTVTLENHDKNIGPLVAPLTERFPGGFIFPRTMFSTPGSWTVNVTDHKPNVYDLVGSFTVNYPADIAAVHAHDETRGLDLFTLVMILVALVILAIALSLYRANRLLRVAILSPSEKENRFSLKIPWLWIAIPIDLVVVVLIGVFLGSHASHGNGGFVQACALSGGVWHENVPMRDGRPTSTVAVLGCMLGSGEGTLHFADPREFAYFTRRSNPVATMTPSTAAIDPGVPVTLTFSIRDENGKPVTGLTREHDRILHVITVSKDLTQFSHLHVEDTQPVSAQMLAAATFPVRAVFPKPGTYLIGLEYTVRAQTFTQQFAVNVGTLPRSQEPQRAEGLTQAVNGMDVTLAPPPHIQAGTVQKLFYHFEENGKPATDLEPYLAATMHMSIVKTDLQKFVHTHAELPQSLWDSIFAPRDPNAKHVHVFLPDRFGPDLVAYVLFPVPGQYEIFGEVNRNGRIELTKFTVNVE